MVRSIPSASTEDVQKKGLNRSHASHLNTRMLDDSGRQRPGTTPRRACMHRPDRPCFAVVADFSTNHTIIFSRQCRVRARPSVPPVSLHKLEVCEMGSELRLGWSRGPGTRFRATLPYATSTLSAYPALMYISRNLEIRDWTPQPQNSWKQNGGGSGCRMLKSPLECASLSTT